LPQAQPAEKIVAPVPDKVKTAAKTVKLTDLLKTDPKKEDKQSGSPTAPEKVLDTPYTEDQLRAAWMEFAEQRRKFQAEFQMLSQQYELRGSQIVVTLLSPVHETMLNNIKAEISAHLRDKLKNNLIQVTGELKTTDEKRVIYTNREKFDYLAEKNPLLRELKDRLGLDTDF
jgi:hypothetical protein